MKNIITKTDSKPFLPKKLGQVSIILFGAMLILVTFVSLIEDNITIIVLTFLYSIVSLGFMRIISDRDTFYEMLMLNSIFLLFYFLYLISVHYSVTTLYDQWFLLVDEPHFYKNHEDVAYLISQGAGLIDIRHIFKYSETALFLYIQGELVLLANYFGESSVLTQKLFNIYICAMFPSIIFYFLKNIVDKKSAFYAALIYGFFSHSFAYSPYLIRDELGAFLYVMIFYFYLKPSSNKNFIIILIFAFLSYFLRPETGMFALMIAATYVYFQYSTFFTNKSFAIFLGFVILVPVVIALIIHFHAIDTMVNLLNRSSETQIRQAQGLKDSVGSSLSNLPIFVKLPLRLFLGQIQYFPPWTLLYNSFFHGIVFFNLSGFFAGIFWFFVWPFILIGVFKDKLFQILNNDKLFFLFIISIVYITMLSLIGATPRKLMYVYPILYLIAAVSYTRMHIQRRKKIVYFTFLVYILLIALYLLLKYGR